MGDIATLLERAEEKLDRSKAEAFAKKALAGDGFSLEDFRDQLRQIKKAGLAAPQEPLSGSSGITFFPRCTPKQIDPRESKHDGKVVRRPHPRP